MIQIRKAMTQINSIRQGKRSVAAYIQEFRSLAGWLVDWSQAMLIKYFWDRLNREIIFTCLSRGVPRTLHQWCMLAGEVEIDLVTFHECTSQGLWKPYTPERKDSSRMRKGEPSPRCHLVPIWQRWPLSGQLSFPVLNNSRHSWSSQEDKQHLNPKREC